DIPINNNIAERRKEEQQQRQQETARRTQAVPIANMYIRKPSIPSMIDRTQELSSQRQQKLDEINDLNAQLDELRQAINDPGIGTGADDFTQQIEKAKRNDAKQRYDQLVAKWHQLSNEYYNINDQIINENHAAVGKMSHNEINQEWQTYNT
ncbi:MAG: ABC transporter C-terminal domain-containing protein, partial [bacterium]